MALSAPGPTNVLQWSPRRTRKLPRRIEKFRPAIVALLAPRIAIARAIPAGGPTRLRPLLLGAATVGARVVGTTTLGVMTVGLTVRGTTTRAGARVTAGAWRMVGTCREGRAAGRMAGADRAAGAALAAGAGFFDGSCALATDWNAAAATSIAVRLAAILIMAFPPAWARLMHGPTR